ncbi:malate synthase G [Alkalicoccus luteus]|uniref:Malate synthase G n=1 Tax=Alkalicoccus luteus TaxID=1237094 RepID=A0A969PPY4_9BACI|nr:malate synthase G [Alkalicoccus luteus]
MMKTVRIGSLRVHPKLKAFVEEELLPGTDISPDTFWEGAGRLINGLKPENERLLAERRSFQKQLDSWYETHDATENQEGYLREIGYLEDEPEPFTVGTTGIDPEINKQPGPQLVVPLSNPRYVLNAANARWGSLYDSLYGSDILPEDDGRERGTSYNPKRGEEVIRYAKKLLDQHVPLTEGSHADVQRYRIRNGKLEAELTTGAATLAADQLKGWRGEEEEPEAILLEHHRLHLEIQMDRNHPIGKTDAAGVKDILTEAAITSIMDAEDSVAAVDTEEKTAVYRSWLGLMKGTLETSFDKGGKTVTRRLNEDRTYRSPSGEDVTLSGRVLMLVRNVGHLMTTDMITLEDGSEAPEGIVDGLVTAAAALHDLKGNSPFRNSAAGSIYIVKPKMHGSREVAFTNHLMTEIEKLYGLAPNTIKIGVMDEERRTSLNLRACIREVKDRIFFINTGFLDRTGDEIHTSFRAGPMIRKAEMKTSSWLGSYEEQNVSSGLRVHLHERGQIGKGMWAMPDEMKLMMEQKDGQLLAGGSTAWVPSPTAAVLHALHYHQVDVQDVHRSKLEQEPPQSRMLEVPVASDRSWSDDEIQGELENNAQGILGYVVRWVEHGIGCSKVPDIHGTNLMEDRATLRISSQHIANWLAHGICTEDQVRQVMAKMAALVDEQNADDPEYRAMTDNLEKSDAFQAALELVLEGGRQPNGYTEPILHRRRRAFKERMYVNQ